MPGRTKPILVGTYEVGYEWVRLYLRPGTGANFVIFPSDKGLSQIFIGADGKEWAGVVCSVLHEVYELLYDRNGCTFSRYMDDSKESGNFTFLLNHAQHATICHDAARFLVDALPDLAKSWKGWGK